MTYRIRTVAEMTGIPRNTLIAWERRYGFIRPARHTNGYRSYSEADVEKLRQVQNALHAGLKISEAVALIEKTDGGPDGADSAAPGPEIAEENFEKIVENLTEALIDYQREQAEAMLKRLDQSSFEDRLLKVYFPILRRIGTMWETGEVSIAQEHYASAILRTHMASTLLSVGVRGRRADHAACTTFEGDMHELAALALSINLSIKGQRVSYLGPNLPSEEVVNFCLEQGVKLLCVSMIRRPERKVLRSYLKAMGKLALMGTRVVLGGSVLRDLDIEVPSGVEIAPEWEKFALEPS